MKTLFRILFLFSSYLLSAESTCDCGTLWDSQVHQIGSEICKVLVEIEFVHPPKHFWAINENGDDDLYVDGMMWERTFTAKNYWHVNWQCEYVNYHCFRSQDNSLYRCEDSLCLIEDLQSDIDKVKNKEIKTIERQIDRASIRRNPSKASQEIQIELYEDLEQRTLLYNRRCKRVEELEQFVYHSYETIFANCYEKHNSDLALYHLGFLKLTTGDYFSAIEQIKQINNFENLGLQEQAETRFELGKTQALLGLYDEAIESLTKAIESNPKKVEAYFERALAYFEKGEFEQAFEDFLSSDFKITPLKKSDEQLLAFAGGLIKGASFGAAHSIENFAPSIYCSLQGLANGLWSFACTPVDVSKEMVEVGKSLYSYMRDQSALDSLRALIPELDELIGNWDEHTEFRKGELIGTIIGTYGTEVFLGAASAKGIKLYNNLRKANGALSLNSMVNLEKRSLVLNESAKWHEARVRAIQEARKGAEELGEKMIEVNLAENQARKMLHNLGFKTFAKPKEMKIKDFHVRISENGGGMQYIYKKNKDFVIRVMPGNELSKWPAQRKPYVVHSTPSGIMDKTGKYVKRKDTSAHIPFEEYEFGVFVEALQNGK